MRRIHLIGGPHDGETIVVPEGWDRVELVADVQRVALRFDDGINFDVAPCRVVTYRPDLFCGKRSYDTDGAERWRYEGWLTID